MGVGENTDVHLNQSFEDVDVHLNQSFLLDVVFVPLGLYAKAWSFTLVQMKHKVVTVTGCDCVFNS